MANTNALREILRGNPTPWFGVDPGELCCCDCPGFVAALCRDPRVPETLGFCEYGDFDAVDGAERACDYLQEELEDLEAWAKAQATLERADMLIDAMREGDA